jgi:hypothetical protein
MILVWQNVGLRFYLFLLIKLKLKLTRIFHKFREIIGINKLIYKLSLNFFKIYLIVVIFNLEIF